MSLNETMIAEIAQQLGLNENPGISAGELRRMEQKSDAELEQEILRLRQELAARGIPREKQAALARSLMPMMDRTQKARLQKIIGLIER